MSELSHLLPVVWCSLNCIGESAVMVVAGPKTIWPTSQVNSGCSFKYSAISLGCRADSTLFRQAVGMKLQVGKMDRKSFQRPHGFQGGKEIACFPRWLACK
jgi:hypothetical protein